MPNLLDGLVSTRGRDIAESMVSRRSLTGAWVNESAQAAADNAALDAAIYGTGMYTTAATQANPTATTGTEILRQIEQAAATLQRNDAPRQTFAVIPPSIYDDLERNAPEWAIRSDTVRIRDGFLATSASTTRRTSSSTLSRIDAALTQFRRAGFIPTTIAVSDAVYEEVKREVRPMHVAMPVPIAAAPSEADQYATTEAQTAETLFGVRLVRDSFTRGFQIACEMV